MARRSLAVPSSAFIGVRELLVFAQPVWANFGSGVGQPEIRDALVRSDADRAAVIRGHRGGDRFVELIG